MCHARQFDSFRVSAKQRLDVVQVLEDGDSIARSLVGLIPLIVLVENQ
jgi:hypothetical protein